MAAICHLLGYAQIMSQQGGVRLVSSAWFFGLINGILLDYMISWPIFVEKTT